jgi:hypothetical protein
VHNSDSLPW